MTSRDSFFSKRKKWNIEDNISETELATAVDENKVSHLRIAKIDESYIVLIELKRKKNIRFLATRRIPDQPRRFQSLSRLNNLLEEIAPSLDVTMSRRVKENSRE